jgi:hypothetical protein
MRQTFDDYNEREILAPVLHRKYFFKSPIMAYAQGFPDGC